MVTARAACRPARVTAAAVGVAVAVAVAGCSASSSSPAPSSSASAAAQQEREQQLQPLIVACLVRRGVIPAQDVSHQSWYRGGHVTVDGAFAFWWRDFAGFPVNLGDDQHLSDVVRSAAEGDWPTGTCGPEPSSR